MLGLVPGGGLLQVQVQLLGVDALGQGTDVALATLAPQPALGPAEVLAPVAAGQQLALGGGVGQGPEGGQALLVAPGQ